MAESKKQSGSKMVLFGVEVDAPAGHSDVNAQHLPKAKGVFMPIVTGLAFAALAILTIVNWNSAMNAEKELSHKATELEQAKALAADLQTRVNVATEKVRALETEKATLSTDLDAKTKALHEADELLVKKGLKKKPAA